LTRRTTILGSTVQLALGPLLGVQSIATFAIRKHDVIGNALDLRRDLAWAVPGLGLEVLDPLPISPVLTKRRDMERLVVVTANLLEATGIEPPRGTALQGINNGIGKPEKAASVATGHPSVVLLD
jgi:hypothetical protein